MLVQEIAALIDENKRLKEETQHLSNQKIELTERNTRLKEKLANFWDEVLDLKRNRFGKKSERFVDSNQQQFSFNEIELEKSTDPNAKEDAKETITYIRHKGKQKKKPLPDNLEREVKEIDLPEEEKFCNKDGSPLQEVGVEVTEKLKTYPARHVVVVEKKKKYACPTCSECMKQARAESILPGTIATSELLSYIIFSKFFQGLPLYRLEERYQIHGIKLSRGTMARWLIKSSKMLTPIVNILEERAMDTGYMAIDATRIQVLKEAGRRAETKSAMWARGSPELGIALFDYHESEAGYVAEKLLAGFNGAVQADAHRGHARLKKNNITLLGCFMHARRRFEKAWVAGERKPGLAEDGLKKIRRIYLLERKFKKLSGDDRYTARLRYTRPLLDELNAWSKENLHKMPKKSLTRVAMNYLLKEWPELEGFMSSGRYEIDNGWVERAIRKFAIGRKNWLFASTVDGAKASAILYSLSVTAKINGKDPYQVLKTVFDRLPKAETIDEYEKLADLFLAGSAPSITLH